MFHLLKRIYFLDSNHFQIHILIHVMVVMYVLVLVGIQVLVQVEVEEVDVWRVVEFTIRGVSLIRSHCALYQIPMGRNLRWISVRCTNEFPPQFVRTPSQMLRGVEFLPNGKNRYYYGHPSEFSSSPMDNFYDPKVDRII